jgi:hypothetical protein
MVVIGQEAGFSYGGTSGDAFSLEDPVSATVKDAQVQGYEFLLRARISYGALARSMNSKAAFESATKLVVANMIKSFAKRLEIIMIYGRDGLGKVDSSYVSGTTVPVQTAEWAPGIWSGSVDTQILVYNETDDTAIATRPVSAVDLEARTISMSTLSAGEQAALAAALTAAKTVKLWHKGAKVSNSDLREFHGLKAIIENTGTLFNINSSTYDLWKGITYSAGSAALSFAKIQKAVARGVEKGLDGDVVAFVAVKSWENLLSDQAALRRYDSSYSSSMAEVGAKQIRFHSQNGMIEIRPSIYVKESHCFILPVDELVKVGSTDVTFKLPGSNDRFFRELESQAGYELRAYADLSLFCHTPARLILVNNIVNS